MKKCQPRSLTPFLDGELTEDAWQELDEHLQSCPSCAAQLDELTAASQQVRAMGRAQIPGDALKSALDVIAGRAGLTGAQAMTQTTEVARATPVTPEIIEEHWPAETTVADQAWTPAPAAEAMPEAPETTPADAAGVEAEADTAPTWVEPERWHPAGPAETGAPAFVPSPPSAQEPENLAADAEPEAEAEPPAVGEDVEPEPSGGGLEAHPSPPPAQLVPSWLDTPAASDAELEEAGRAAVDDAIGAPTELEESAAEATAPDIEIPSMADYSGATAEAEAELRAPIEPTADVEPVEPAAPQRPWYASIFGRHSSPPAEEAPSAVPEPAQETPERPEAERLMWITPRPPAVEPEPEPKVVPEPEPEVGLGPEPEVGPGPEGPAVEAVLEPKPMPGLAPLAGVAAEPTRSIPEPVEPAPVAEAKPELEPMPVPFPKTDASDDVDLPDASHLRRYREALVGARAKPAGAGSRLLAPDTRIKVGLGAALVVIVAVAGILLASRQTHPATTAVVNPTTTHSAQASPAGQPTPSVQPSLAASPATGAGAGTLSELVTAGAGGSGWTVARIRLAGPPSGPGNGITRMVFDLSGSGAMPTAQLGRGSDGNIYLSVPGMALSPDVVAAVTASGAITGMTQNGASGTALTITTKGTPGFSMAYYPAAASAPNRLVLDFK